MTDSITPPEGQLSFSGIPSAEFVEDVDAHMAGEESAESQLKVVTSLMLDMTVIEKIRIEYNFVLVMQIRFTYRC